MIKTSKEAIKYIHSLPKMHKNSDFKQIKQVLAELNNPHKDYKTIHITGTNGKGSVSHYINQILIDNDLKVGMFTSPYIVEFNERIQINNEYIPNKDLLELVNEINTVLEKINVSLVEFEFITVLGFLYFSKKEVDVAVVEVGIGGYHDKTNVIHADTVVINNVGMDHAALIGPSLKDIAIEKSGIIKEKSKVILGKINQDVLNVFFEKAKNENAIIYHLKDNFDFKNIVQEVDGYKFDFKGNQEFKNIKIKSIAEYQIENVCVAIETCTIFLDDKLDENIVRKAVAKVTMEARLQIIKNEPLIILDGAHNVHAANALVSSLKDKYPEEKIEFLVAIMKDKDFKHVLNIFEKVGPVRLTTFEENRSLKKSDIDRENLRYPFISNWENYIDSYNKKSILLVTGSLHFVSEVLNKFN